MKNNKSTLVLKVLVILAFFISGSIHSVAQSTLCPSSATTFCCEYVSNVTLNGVSRNTANTSFNSGPGYQDFSGTSLTTLAAGSTYPVSVTVQANNTYLEYVKIWFDFNGNGNLQDAGELVMDQNYTFVGTHVYTGNITIPTNAYNGDVYIRVIMVYSQVPQLCGSYTYGNTLDFKATITGGIISRKLTVNTSGPSGSIGNVVSSPSGINTGSNILFANFANNSNVTLTASNGSGGVFKSWTGAVSGTSNSIVVPMNADKVVTANFVARPSVTTNAITSITPTSAVSGGNVTADGGDPVTARGICWSTSPNPTIANSTTNDGSGTGSFTSSLSGLTPGATYYVRAYATNLAGTSYGNQVTLTTCAPNPITTSGSTAICQGSSVTLTAPGGSSYQWSNGSNAQSISVSQAGSYSVTVTQANGCSVASAPVVVNVTALPVVTVTPSGPTTFCPTGSVTLTASGANSYSWNSGQTTSAITVNLPNTYTVTGSTNGCTSAPVSTSVTVQDNIPPVISCPFNITVNAESGKCGAAVNYSQPSATDNCGTGTQQTSIPGYTYKGTFGGHSYFLSNTTSTPEAAHAAAIALGGHLVTINSLEENDFVSDMSTQFIWIGLTDRTTEGAFRWVTSEPVNYTNWNSGEPNNAGDEDWAVINWGPNGTWNDWTYSSQALYCIEFEGGSIPTTLVSGPASGSFFPVGTTTVTYSATDAGNNTATCSFTVTVVDNQRPFITTNGNQNVTTINGTCSANATVSATASDNCSVGSPVGTRSDNQPLNASYPKGTTVITWNVTDINGIPAFPVTQTVTVTDNQPPVISCPANINVTAANAAGAVVNYAAPVGSDNCPGATTTRIAGLASGSVFPIGVNTVTYRVTDAAGLTTECSFTVTVSCVAPAISNCPQTQYQQIYSDAGNCSAVFTYNPTITGTSPNVTYTFTGATSASGNGTGSGSAFNVGQTTVTITVSNMCGTASCSFVVTVIDNVLPVAKAKNITVYLDANGNASITPQDINNGSSDNCGPVTLSFNSGIVCGQAAENQNVVITAPAGEVITAIDFASYGTPNGTCGSFNLGTCNALNSVAKASQYLLGQNSAIIPATNAVFGDPCGGTVKRLYVQARYGGVNANTYTFNCSNVGNNNVKLLVTDANGNVSVANAIVTVVDNTNPTINCPAPVTVKCSSAVPAPNTNAVTASDNCSVVVSWVNDAISNQTAPDKYIITRTYRAVDPSGNSATCTQVITVNDDIAPVITHNGNKNVNAASGRCDASVVVSATATDNCGVVSPVGVRSDNAALNAPYPVGTTTITWNANDANGNNAVALTQTVTVTDIQKPVISGMPSNIVKSAVANNCLALITWSAPTTTDNCGIASFSSSDADYNSLGFTLLPVGVHTITYTATDVHGNVETSSFTVTVVDNQNPIITGCPSPIEVSAAAGTCGKQVFWNPPTASDNCPGVTMSGSHVSGTVFPVGTTTVTYTATDAVGLVTTCSFNVVVTDNESPVINNCPQNITVYTGANSKSCSQIATWAAPTATDNCGNVTVTSTHQPGASFSVGTTTVTYSFKDAHNNISTCSFTVTVVDNTAPVFGLTGDVVYLRSNTSKPWNLNGNEDALTVIYSATGWKDYRYETVNTAQLFSSSTRFIFMEGGDGTANEMRTFLQANQTALENWVNAGGKLLLNAAPNEGGNINFGFGGVTLVYPNGTSTAAATVPAHPIFNSPYAPVGTSWQGSSFGHAIITPANASMVKLIHNTSNNLALLVESTWGNGKVMFGGMTLPFFQSSNYGTSWSQPTTGNLHKNIIAYLGGTGNNQQNIVKSNDAGKCGAVITYNAPTATDNCPGVTVAQTAGLPSGSLFPVGVTTNTFEATDAAGNTANYSFTVTINDVQAPTISCPSNINAIATSAAGAVVNYTTPVGNDNCSSTTTRIAGPASGSTFPIGTTLVTHRVTDASGLTAQCSFTVTVVGVPPSINCPANIIVNNTQGECGTNVNFAATETQAIPASTITYSHQPGSFFPVGTTTVTATAINPVGTSVCTFTVTVRDAENPKLINVPSNETVECTEVPAPANVTATDNCGNLGAVQYTEVKADGNCAGNYTLTRTWSVTDAHNNTTTATQVITVVDTKAPVISAQAQNATVECDGAGNTSALQEWLDNHGASAATDDCSGVTWSNNFSTGNWVADCGGTKHVTVVFTATDGCGNASNTTATFRIKDETAPVVATAAGSLDRVVECSDGAAIAAANALVPSATDDCSQITLNLVSDVTTPGCGSTYVRVRKWNFTDACGNTSATYTQTITAKDETAPVISCPASVTLNCQDDNSTAATGVATATDNCSTPVVSYSDASTQSSNVNDAAHYNYTITRTWKAVDACNNVSTCIQTITVQDVTKPVITCPASVTVNCQDNNTSAATGVATATDNCGPVAVTETQTSTQNANVNSPAYYNYTITRTWRATDVTGNYSECVQTITVQDITKPVAVCKPVTITLVNGSASITPQMVNGGSSDNCSPLTFTVSKSSFNCSNIGVNAVTLTVKDVSGNVSTCQATVNVVGEIPTCKITSVPTDNTYTGGNVNSLYLGYGAQSTTLKLDVPASGAPYTFSWSGNGTLSSTTVQSPLFAPTTAGLYTFTVFITNKYGCTTSCTISICVTDIRVMNAKTGTWDGKKVYVCHVPPGNPGNSNTLEISVNAVPAHIGPSGHATDRLGKCEVAVCTAPVYAKGGAPTEVTPQAYASEIKVYPNPTTGVFALLLQNYSKGKVEIQVVDNYGKLVANQSVTVMNQSENVTIDVTKHAAGVYHVRVLSESGVKTLRVVVAR